MNAWKYVGAAGVLLLAEKDDFSNVPTEMAVPFKGLEAQAWGDRPGNPLPEKLVGANRSAIEAALAEQGWFLHN